jgi:hypothetical protein
MASWPKWRRAARRAAAWLVGRRRSGRLETTEVKSPCAGFDSHCFRQGQKPYRLAQTGLADGALQRFAVEHREAGRPIDLRRRRRLWLASLGPQGQDDGDLVPTDGRRRAAASRLGEALVVEPHRGAVDATDNLIGASGFEAHIDRIGVRAANNAPGSHRLQGSVVDLGVKRDELRHDREQILSP